MCYRDRRILALDSSYAATEITFLANCAFIRYHVIALWQPFKKEICNCVTDFPVKSYTV